MSSLRWEGERRRVQQPRPGPCDASLLTVSNQTLLEAQSRASLPAWLRGTLDASYLWPGSTDGHAVGVASGADGSCGAAGRHDRSIRQRPEGGSEADWNRLIEGLEGR